MSKRKSRYADKNQERETNIHQLYKFNVLPKNDKYLQKKVTTYGISS